VRTFIARTAATMAIAGSLGVAGIASPASASKESVNARSVPHYQYGIDTFVNDNCESDATWSNWAIEQVNSFKSLGANSIGITFPFYSDSRYSNNVYTKLVCGTYYSSPSPARVAVIVQRAHAAGLSVVLRPVMDETNLKKQNLWRGLIEPSNTATWFKNYYKTIAPYLAMAKNYNVEHFAISTELDSMSRKSQWRSLIAQAAAIYDGDLTFDFSWNPHDDVQWKGTTAAMDTYRYVKAPITATPARLLALWNRALATDDKVPFISKAVIEEIGIPAQDGAYLTPYAWNLLPISKHKFNQVIQDNWFTMACRFMKSHHMHGIYYWGPAFYKGALSSKPDTADPQDIQPLPQASSIKSCFAG